MSTFNEIPLHHSNFDDEDSDIYNSMDIDELPIWYPSEYGDMIRTLSLTYNDDKRLPMSTGTNGMVILNSKVEKCLLSTLKIIGAVEEIPVDSLKQLLSVETYKPEYDGYIDNQSMRIFNMHMNNILECLTSIKSGSKRKRLHDLDILELYKAIRTKDSEVLQNYQVSRKVHC